MKKKQYRLINTASGPISITTANLHEVGAQDNVARVLQVHAGQLVGGGTVEDQIAAYINTLNYEKMDTDAEIWVEYNDVPQFTLFYLETGDGCPPIPTISTAAYHDGAGALPSNGDTVYTDALGTTTIGDASYVVAENSGGNIAEGFGSTTSGVWADQPANCE